MKKALEILTSAAGGVVGVRLSAAVSVIAAENNLLPDAAKWPRLRAFAADSIIVFGAVTGSMLGAPVGKWIGNKIKV